MIVKMKFVERSFTPSLMIGVKYPVVLLPGVCQVLLIHTMVHEKLEKLTNLPTGSCLVKLKRYIDLV